ncbi:hypothetical protein KIN20_003551 [Parelaphostrongylus tenuis]|uniref:Uncharacterized protein n=1 Tax=Parelaphostrongylus tenuis TaxID=148309 RepID=A0AAD5MIG2_PARTN|nr:hypothetical protein KIN20_003551 [Parelaphostrongylus tenuis]
MIRYQNHTILLILIGCLSFYQKYISGLEVLISIDPGTHFGGALYRIMSEKLRKEGEETQDGGQDEARRIINANKDIEIAAQKCFENLERFLEESVAELNNMNLRSHKDSAGVGADQYARKAFSQPHSKPIKPLREITGLSLAVISHQLAAPTHKTSRFV